MENGDEQRMRSFAENTMRLFIRCGINCANNENKVLGQLGDFKFSFRNYYTVVDGSVPLSVAEELYAIQPVGRTDIRSGGDCGCRPPSTWAVAKNGSLIVITPEETANIDYGVTCGSAIYTEAIKNPNYYFCRSADEYARFPKFIDTYHINTELGLYIFVQKLKEHKLI